MSSKIMGDLSPAEILLNADTQKNKAKKTTAKKQKPQPEKKPKRAYRVNLALREDIGEAIKAEAEAQNRSTNNLIEMIITQYLERR